MPNFPMIFNVNFEDGEIFFEECILDFSFEIKKFFLWGGTKR